MTERSQLPDTIRIGHLVYSVRRDQAAVDRWAVEQSDGEERAGYSGSAEQEIVLSDRMAPDYEAETFLHEVLHQCFRVTGFYPNDHAELNPKDVEERSIMALSGPLLAALRDNPHLVAYLTGGTS